MTLFAEAAHQTATSDREATADLVLTQSVREVLAAYRLASRLGVSLPVTEAAAELTRAGESAARMLGDGS